MGLYTSPHLKKFNERIQINGHQISDDRIASFFKDNRELIKSIESTFFETTTAMAFDYFCKESVDYAIIETEAILLLSDDQRGEYEFLSPEFKGL